MTAREMHIEINQSLQKVAANLTRKYLSEEIDWILNKTQNRFIQMMLRPVDLSDTSSHPLLGKSSQPISKFADQLHTDAIKNLNVSGVSLDAWESPSGFGVECYLPPDYMYLMSDVSALVNLCGNPPVMGPSTTRYYTTLALSQSAASGPLYYVANNTVKIGAKTINIPADLPTYNNYQGFSDKKDVFFLKDFIMDEFRKAKIPVYWEWYGDIYEPNKFIIPSTASGVSPLVRWDGIDVTQSAIKSFSRNSRILPDSIKRKIVDNRLTSNYDVSTMYTPFYNPTSSSPVSELTGHILKVYHDENTIVTNVIISYIRKPSPISLSLGLNCELSESFHQTICDLVVEYIKGQQEDTTGTAIKSQDIEKRVII